MNDIDEKCTQLRRNADGGHYTQIPPVLALALLDGRDAMKAEIAELRDALKDTTRWLEGLITEGIIVEDPSENEIAKSIIRAKSALSCTNYTTDIRNAALEEAAQVAKDVRTKLGQPSLYFAYDVISKNIRAKMTMNKQHDGGEE